MSTSKYFDRICAIVLICTLLVTILFMNGEALGITLIVNADSEAHSDSEYFTDNDRLSDWDTSSATYITLEGDSISISGSNAYEYEGNLVISNSGRYVISGTLDDGYITVDANANSKVWILLQGVELACSDNACLRVDEADKVFLTLAEGTENVMTGGEELSEEALEDGTYGVIFAHDDLTINGSGSLSIQAAYKHGIKANDDLVITGGTITVDAPADGIHVNDSFRLKDACLNITAGDDGILTENEESFIYIESGEITVNAQGDGLHSGGDILIAGGAVTMNAGDDGLHADRNVEITEGIIEIDSCYEGIEAVTITVSGGDITIYPVDDGFNASSGSTGDLFGGELNPGNMESFEPMTHPEEMEMFSENGGQPLQMPEMGNGGQPPEMSAMEYGGQPPEMSEMETGEQLQETQDVFIRISGGTITIINENGNDADGLDSNGDIYITGGDIRISLTDNGTNSALDIASEYGGIAEISGGTIIACGSSSMAEAFDTTSTQCSVLYNISSGMEAGTILTVENEDGAGILSWEVPCSFSSAVLSSPEMYIDGQYTITADDNEETITLTEVSASFGDAQSTMFAGNMNWGGMQQREPKENIPSDFQGGTKAETDAGTDPEPMASAVAESESDLEDESEQENNTGVVAEPAGPGQGGENFEPSYDPQVWVLTLISFLVLGIALPVVKKYKRT